MTPSSPPAPFLPTRLALVVLFATAAALIILALTLQTAAVVAIDTRLLEAAAAVGSPAQHGAVLELTSLGSLWVIWLPALLFGMLLLRLGHRPSAALLWLAVATGALANRGLKELFGRTRPELFEWRTPYAGELAFPSGHSMNAMVAYLTLALVLARVLGPGRMRSVAVGACAMAVVLVGASRVYLGVHYPTDVIGGFLAGAAWVMVCALVVGRRA
jgi:undecaprenyl-diphosphatase